ncbi:hypothetical protein Bca101_056324 [Brassica carinata]
MQTQQQHRAEIPVDLMIEILLRLPTKSIARCRCVSKYWSAILNRTDFTELFMARIGTKETVLSTIYNLSTRQAIHLPNVKTSSNNFVKTYLGFDPIDKKFKVLSITTTQAGDSDEHQVLTLGTPNISWRSIKSCFISYYYPHYFNDGICINGGLYYVAALSMRPLINAIVGFDVKSEKLRIVNKAEDMVLWGGSTFVNYKGRLGAFVVGGGVGVVTGETTSFEL